MDDLAPATTIATTSFAELGLCDEIVDSLSARGIEAPFPVQALTIPDALAGKDVCGKAKTGSGKTLAFGLPVLHNASRRPTPKRPTGTRALVPTRELAVQVHDELVADQPRRLERSDPSRPSTAARTIDKQISQARARASTSWSPRRAG